MEELIGQKNRIRLIIRNAHALLDSVEGFLDADTMDVESAHNVAYTATRLVGEVARLFQMQRHRRE